MVLGALQRYSSMIGSSAPPGSPLDDIGWTDVHLIKSACLVRAAVGPGSRTYISHLVSYDITLV